MLSTKSSRTCLLALLVGLGCNAAFVRAQSEPLPNIGNLVLQARSQQETSPGSGRYHTLTRDVSWDPRKTAIVICDMWDRHWCRGATDRVGEMAPRMNAVVRAARELGVLIIHCPSDTMEFYKDFPQRHVAQAAKHVETKEKLEAWRSLNPEREPALPIDDSDGGCDCDPRCTQGNPWTRQIETIEILPQDAITDSGEAYYLLEERGIDNVIVMGVHTNMCVLGRPFSIRQLVTLGKNVVLLRDLTDTMYCSRSAPYVNHFTGTDLVISHIERHWCPTAVSSDLIGGPEFRFAADHRPTLAMLIGEDEYQTERTLPEFAVKYLGQGFRTQFVFASDTDLYDFPGIVSIMDADLLLVSVRRRLLPTEQLAWVRQFVQSGKPIVGIRTASHAFAPREGAPPPGHDAWPEFDAAVLGGHYVGHHGNHPPNDPRTLVQVVPDARRHPITRGLKPMPQVTPSWLYKTSPLATGAERLLIGWVEGREPPEPVAWTYRPATGNRVFYTSLGHPDDFANPEFRRLLVNGVYWAAGIDGAEAVNVQSRVSGKQ